MTMQTRLTQTLKLPLLGVLLPFFCWLNLLTPVQADVLRFGVLSRERNLQPELTRHDADNLAFVLINGLKTEQDPCDEKDYQQRKTWFDTSTQSIFVSLAGSDWQDCDKNNALAQIRELMFHGDFSLGASKLPLTRLATNPKFSQYVENTRWEFENILFATVNLPAKNNHYRPEAGRNGEFEDRLVANRLWLQRLFALARQKRIRGLVLFSDGNAWQPHGKARRDGFSEVRAEITQLASKIHGKLLLVDHQPERTSNTIQWSGNIGHISLAPGWHVFQANPKQPQLFTIVQH
jgi:hypothetical protein